jgi:hypothetical protein
MIVRRQVRRQQVYRRQGDRPIGEEFENQRPFPRSPGRADATVSLGLRQVQPLRAVGKERLTPVTEVQPASLHFSERGDEACCRLALACNERMNFGEQLFVGQVRERECDRLHVPLYHRDF